MHVTRLVPVVLVLLAITPIGYAFFGSRSSIVPNPGLLISVSNPQRFTSDAAPDFVPAVVQRLDGTVQVFYEYVPITGKGSQNPTINYRTTTSPSNLYNASSWSGPQTLLSTPLSQNVAPSVSQAKNGTLYLSFASNRTGSFNIFLSRYSPGVGWYPEQQITLSTANQIVSSPLAASDGSLWLFYDRTLSATSKDIYYKVWRSGSWSAEAPFTNEGSTIQDAQPSAFQMSDGTIWIVWSRTDTVANISNLYYEMYKNGVWSSPVQLTSNANPDQHPHIIQDENSTIWVAWNRELPVSTTVFQNDIFYTYSVNNGASFVPEVNLTNDVGCSVCPEDIQSSLAQLKDGRVYLFWASNRDPQNYWNIYYATTNPQPFHHVAVTALSASSLKLRDFNPVAVNVTVGNLGTFPESFWLFIRATNTSVVTVAAQFLSLGAGQIMSLSIVWNTNGVRPAKYVFSANVAVPSTETQIVTGDNKLTLGIIWLVPPGDVNMDGRVDILDGAAVAYAFGTRPGDTLWNPMADLTGDGVIDILDAAIVAVWFGVYT